MSQSSRLFAVLLWALHQAVQAGPAGSTFADPSSLPASTATAPLGTSAPGNYYAGAPTLG